MHIFFTLDGRKIPDRKPETPKPFFMDHLASETLKLDREPVPQPFSCSPDLGKPKPEAVGLYVSQESRIFPIPRSHAIKKAVVSYVIYFQYFSNLVW